MSEQQTSQAVDPDTPEANRVSDAVGLTLLQHIIGELNTIPHPSIEHQSLWSTLSETHQAEISERLTRRIQYEVRAGYKAILANGVPAIDAELKSVKFSGKDVQGTLVLPRRSDHTHDLADFAGMQVIVVLASNLEEYFEGMGEIVTHHDQGELDLDTDDDELVDPIEVEAVAEAAGMDPDEVARKLARVREDRGDELQSSDSLDELPAHLADIDPTRIIRLEGRPVELSPNPECSECGGDGMVSYQDEELETGVGYEACDCTKLPEAP